MDSPLVAALVAAHADGPDAVAVALLLPVDGAPVTLPLLQVRADRRHADERGPRRTMLALRCWELYQAAEVAAFLDAYAEPFGKFANKSLIPSGAAPVVIARASLPADVAALGGVVVRAADLAASKVRIPSAAMLVQAGEFAVIRRAPAGERVRSGRGPKIPRFADLSPEDAAALLLALQAHRTQHPLLGIQAARLWVLATFRLRVSTAPRCADWWHRSDPELDALQRPAIVRGGPSGCSQPPRAPRVPLEPLRAAA